MLPPGCNRSTAARIVPRSSTRVGGSTTSTVSSKATTDTVSSGRSDSASSAIELFTRPRRVRMSMLPERSTTRVRFTDGRSEAASSRAVTATRTSWVPSADAGAIPVSVRRASSVSVGAGSSYGSALTHSSARTDSAGGRRPSATSACATRNEPLSTSRANVDSGSMLGSTKPLIPASTNVLSSSSPGSPASSADVAAPPTFDEVAPAAPPWSPPSG